MSGVELKEVKKSFGNAEIIHSVSLSVAAGEFVVFVGPSGCGKSTLLRLIAGLEDATAGAISIGGRDVTRVDPADRGIAMVFQSYALYPHMTVEENMGFGLRMTGTDRAVVAERVKKAAAILHLDQLLKRKPKQLSGGQRQRVAIGRAIVREPQVFLFDEPLSNLDAELRVQMRLEIAKLHKELGATMIYVTHDQVEAMTLADKIVVLNAGKVEQVGSPLDLYNKPVNQFVAGFIGSPRMNFLDLGPRDGDAYLLPGGNISVPANLAAKPAFIGVRPEHLELVEAGRPGALKGKVTMTEHLGSDTYAYVALDGAEDLLVVRLSGEHAVKSNQPIGVLLDPGMAHVFAADGRSLASARPVALEAA